MLALDLELLDWPLDIVLFFPGAAGGKDGEGGGREHAAGVTDLEPEAHASIIARPGRARP